MLRVSKNRGTMKIMQYRASTRSHFDLLASKRFSSAHQFFIGDVIKKLGGYTHPFVRVCGPMQTIMQMRAAAIAAVTARPQHLSGGDLLPTPDFDATVLKVGEQGVLAITVVDNDVIPHSIVRLQIGLTGTVIGDAVSN